jgi:FkbM family methyltransferase
MIDKVFEFHAHTQPLRRRFGTVAGTRLGLALRNDYKTAAGVPFRVPVPTLPHPVWLRAGTSDSVVLWQILIWEELRFDLPSPPSLIVDAGANIGLASAWFANRYPHARVIALEADRRNFEVLRRNVAPYPNAEPRLQALWSRSARVRIINPEAEAYAFRVDDAEPAGPSDDDTVDAVDIPTLLRETGADRIDLLKLDVEGAELEILRDGADAWIDRVETLAVELHDRFRPGCSEALDRAVAGRGFTRQRAGEYEVLRKR